MKNTINEHKWAGKLDICQQLFPFHLVINSQFTLQQIGNKIQNFHPSCQINQSFFNFFKILKPRGIVSFSHLKDNSNQLFILESLGTIKKMRLKAQILLHESPIGAIIICTPLIRNTDDFMGWNLKINDFPFYDSLPDYLFLLQAQQESLQQASNLMNLLKSQKEHLLKKNIELTELNYIISHDLKTPIRGISSLTEWLYSDYAEQLDSTAQEYLLLLKKRVVRAHNLIESLAKYARIENLNEKQSTINLNEVIEKIKLDNNIIMLHKPYKLIVKKTLPTIINEQNKIYQLFFNLIINGIIYNENPTPTIEIDCKKNDTIIEFSIKDNGIGISEKHYNKVFKMFQTLQVKDKFESTGVGLTIVKKIIEYNHSKIWLESEVGKGTTFYFTLPLKQEENQNIAALKQSQSQYFIP